MSMAQARSWWRMRQIRHRDAVVLSVLSASFLLEGEINEIRTAYDTYIAPYAGQPQVVLNVVLTVLGFTTSFGGVFVLLGGLHFSWGRVSRGRFLVGLGLGVSLLGLISRLARATLAVGTPITELERFTAGFTGLGVLIGIGSHALMGQYALMIKKHARRVWRRWRKPERPGRRPTGSEERVTSGRTGRAARR
ncbi:MAG TPA: hypothetical protein VF992_03140 [Thermoplasmata archaeon]